MKDLNEKLKNISSLLDLNNDFVVLDVDRTIINTTSWYQACITEDLLISKLDVSLFKKINDERFGKNHQLSDEEFRRKTLKLLTPNITKDFLNKIQEFKSIYEFLRYQNYSNILNLYVAGSYTARHSVMVYNIAIQYILWLLRLYGNNLKIIFLTSGYEPFIKGVVDEIISSQKINNLNYIVIGSEIEIKKGISKETFHIGQYEKKMIIKDIISKGGKIRFLADDSKDDMELFEIVKENGGESLVIEHKPNMKENDTWNEYWKQLDQERIKKELMNKENPIQLMAKEIKLPQFLKKLSKVTNEIGISYLNVEDYNKAVLSIAEKMNNCDNKNAFLKNIEEFIFRKDEKVYMRGFLFYNWLPQYIFISNKTLNQRWEELIKTTIITLKVMQDERILKKELCFEEKVILYCLFDHLQEAILYLLNLIEQNHLYEMILKNEQYKDIVELAQEISDLLYMFYYNNSKIDMLLNKILEKIINAKVIEKIPEYVPKYKTMRELDDNIVIFKFIKEMAENIIRRKIKLDYIISFPYGGITLGFALNSYFKVYRKVKKLPQTINCHFSSKQALREKRVEENGEFSAFKYIPNIYNKYLSDIKNGNSNILLLDNNVTTFKTLDLTKQYLKQIGNNVYCAVASINYDNIVNYLFDKDCETLVNNWRNVLDFAPVQNYITAFNTWNTSDKTKTLQNIFYTKGVTSKYKEKQIIEVKNDDNYIFKACRIQNVYDLNVAVKNGASMIGIHAVYPDRIKFIKNELKYEPYMADFNKSENLPIDIFQLEAIRKMQEYVPKDVKKAILFERKTEIETMLETCKIYNIKPNDVHIQLQHRTDEKQINDIKFNISEKIIATVGIFQKDFKEYFWKIHNVLNPNIDFILIDLSKHQPDLISYSESYNDNIDRIDFLEQQAKCIVGNTVPIIIADDTSTIQMDKYLKIIQKYNIKIKGVDMQNSLEFTPVEQKYQMFEHNGSVYQIKIRKSPSKMVEWKYFFDNLDKKIFKR